MIINAIADLSPSTVVVEVHLCAGVACELLLGVDELAREDAAVADVVGAPAPLEVGRVDDVLFHASYWVLRRES